MTDSLEIHRYDVDMFKFKTAENFCVSYPKSGRSWLRFLLLKYFHLVDGKPFSSDLDISDYTEKSEKYATLAFSHDGTAPAFYNMEKKLFTAADMLDSKQFFEQKSILFLVRDPRDVLLSFYFHLTERKKIFSGSVGQFFGSSEYGLEKLVNFMNNWVDKRDTVENFCIARYEDLMSDDIQEVQKILNFFGYPVDGTHLKVACEDSRFDKMKKLEREGKLEVSNRFGVGESGSEDSYKIRKGQVKGYLEDLPKDVIESSSQYLKEKLNPIFKY